MINFGGNCLLIRFCRSAKEENTHAKFYCVHANLQITCDWCFIVSELNASTSSDV